jgi:hypothetical protein
VNSAECFAKEIPLVLEVWKEIKGSFSLHGRGGNMHLKTKDFVLLRSVCCSHASWNSGLVKAKYFVKNKIL